MFRGLYLLTEHSVLTVPKDLRLRFGMAVRAARLSRDWSQERLAQEAGLDRTYVSGLERGVRNPALLTQERIAVALGVDLRALIADAEAMN